MATTESSDDHDPLAGIPPATCPYCGGGTGIVDDLATCGECGWMDAA